MIDNKTPMMFDLILLKGERNITTGEERKTKKREREKTPIIGQSKGSTSTYSGLCSD